MLRFLFLFQILATSVFAQAAEPPKGETDKKSRDYLQKQLEKTPEKFLETVAQIILGFGQDGSIDERGIENFIGLERAKTRAFHMRRMLQADIDADGAITMEELRILQQVSSSRQRGVLELAHRMADIDQDGTVSSEELWQQSRIKSLQTFDHIDALGWRSLMSFDENGDGKVTLDEIIRVATQTKEDLI